MENKEMKDIVKETQEIYRRYRDSQARQTWATHAQEDREFRMGKQWTAEEREVLDSRGQAAVVVNRIHPAVEMAKSLMTYNKPAFRVAPREDSDNKTAKAMNGLLEYIFQISDGNSQLRQVIDDYYVTGMGAMYIYQDPLADNGMGEVKFKSVDPLDLYIDPNSRNRMCDDAENIIHSRLYTREQAKKWKPLFDSKIDVAESDIQSDRPTTDRVDDGETSFPETDAIFDTAETEHIRGYERFKMVVRTKYRIFENFSGQEKLMSEQEFFEYIKQPAWIIEGRVFTREMQAIAFAEKRREQAARSGQQYTADIQSTSFRDLIKSGEIETVKVRVRNIRLYCIMGDKLLYQRDLPHDLHHYPLVLLQNLFTGTPFPTSDVRLVKHLQEYINKIRSLIIAHAASSTNVKVLLPRGSVDKEQFEQEWAKVGAVGVEVDYDLGDPKPVPPAALPNELYANERTAKSDIDHQFGLYEMMMGNPESAPQTYQGTVSLDEFGQRKIRGKMQDVEQTLNRLGRVLIPFVQQLYTKRKIVRIIQPNNSINEYVINKRLVDDKSQEIKVLNDISRGNYDVIVVSGSTLPTDRYAQLQLYMDAYRNGLIDQQEVLKKTEVFDMEGVLKRTDLVAKLQNQVEKSLEVIKGLKGDLQTADREVKHARQKAELEKFKSTLDKETTTAHAATNLYQQRLNDELNATKKAEKEKD